MMTTHDDVPHPVPPTAYLRYKENWFFILIDVRNSVFGMAHFNYEPGHNRARVSCNLMVRGEQHQYGNEIPFPEKFAYAPEIGDDRLKVKFVEAHTQIDFALNSDAVNLSLTLRKHAPTFDYEAYDAANPEKPTVREIVNFATNQAYHHQQQAMTMTGSLQMKAGKAKGETITIDGMAYRDHSRAIRVDNMTLKHVWAFLYFPNRVFGAMSVYGVLRQQTAANGGYVYDSSGLRSLKDIDIAWEGKGDEFLPAAVSFKMNDVYGAPYTVLADIKNRYGYVPLVVEKSGGGVPAYRIYENFCPLTLVETGEKGYALVEIGDNPTYTGSSAA
jgi:hypothetical protein